ncbi:MAG: CaiB/BaiF CoA-transferase family protein [Pseudomonadota bacterium]
MGPLSGIKVIEVRGIGPGPYAGMLMADLGAEVTVVDRVGAEASIAPPAAVDVTMRGKRSIKVDLKSAEGVELLLQMVERSDVLIEGFRPGVAERLGFGPEACHVRNAGLVYGRITGWGQTGPLSQAAGHDINYIALAGALGSIGPRDKPAIPLNLIGDYAGGSLFLVIGVLAALVERQRSGQGEVIDAAIVDGTASLTHILYTLAALKLWQPVRGANLLDGGAPHYDVYRTADDKFVSVGPLEPQFYALFVEKAGLDAAVFNPQLAFAEWPARRAALADAFATRTRDEWCELLEGTDACFAPVLDYTEAPSHPHNAARQNFVTVGGMQQPAPAPRFERATPETPSTAHVEGSDTETVLAELGLNDEAIAALRQQGVI